MFGERLKRARDAAGLSQKALSARAGISAMAISKLERGENNPTSKTVIALARALDTRIEYFFRPDTVVLEGVEYRKRASTPKKLLKQITADVIDQAERFLELLALFPQRPLPHFQVPNALPERISSYAEIESLVLSLRDAWDLGHGAIPLLVDVFEDRGILVVTTDIDTEQKFDGLAAKVNGVPLVVVHANWPGDRQRFTLAHELGHLILEGRLSEGLDEERACNHFAGAFLLPKPTIQHELSDHRNHLTMRELYALKQEYGLSMQSCIFRAHQAGIITEAQKISLFRTFQKKGWRKTEPGTAYPSETPSAFERLATHAYAEAMISSSKAAELMGLSTRDFYNHQRLEIAHEPAHY